jgi:hypothetical protein
VRRELIANSEAEMAELVYDIKVYQIQKISDKDIIAYQVEIMTLDDPDVVYLYNYQMTRPEGINDPHTLVIDEVNLQDHPLIQGQQPKKQSKLPIRRSQTRKSNGVQMGQTGGVSGR